MTYEGAVDIEAISDPRERRAIELQISEFGQTPRQLFTSPHARRKPRAEWADVPPGAADASTEAHAHASAAAPAGYSASAAGSASEQPTSTPRKAVPGPANWLGEGRRPVPTKRLRPHRDAVTGLAFDASSRYVYTASLDQFFKSHTLADEKQVRSVNLCSLSLSSLAAVPGEDGLVAVGAYSDHVYVYSSETGSIAETLSSHHAAVSALAVQDELLVSASWDSSIKVWERRGRKYASMPIGDLQEHNSEVLAVALSPDKRLVVSGDSSGMLVLWTLADMAMEREFDSHADAVSSLAFSPDSRCVVSASKDGTVRVHEIAGGTLFETRADAAVHCVLTDGKVVLAGGESGRLLAWELASGAQILSGPATSSAIHSMSVSKDCSTLGLGCADGSVHIFDLQQSP